MSELTGQGGELRATIEITRKATGLVETYELVGRVTPEQEGEILGLLQNMKLDCETRSLHATTGAMQGPGAAVNNQPKE